MLTTTLAVAETAASPETVRTLDVDPEIVSLIGTSTEVSVAVISKDPSVAAAAPAPNLPKPYLQAAASAADLQNSMDRCLDESMCLDA